MIGLDDGADDIGVIPSAISWLYQLIEEQKQLTGARFSVRVSAVELTGQQETLRDLLSVSNSQGLSSLQCRLELKICDLRIWYMLFVHVMCHYIVND